MIAIIFITIDTQRPLVQSFIHGTCALQALFLFKLLIGENVMVGHSSKNAAPFAKGLDTLKKNFPYKMVKMRNQYSCL